MPQSTMTCALPTYPGAGWMTELGPTILGQQPLLSARTAARNTTRTDFIVIWVGGRASSANGVGRCIVARFGRPFISADYSRAAAWCSVIEFIVCAPLSPRSGARPNIQYPAIPFSDAHALPVVFIVGHLYGDRVSVYSMPAV